MDRVKSYFNKPWNPTAMHSTVPLPNFVRYHLCMVYWTLFNTTAFSLFGAYAHLNYSIGGWITTLVFVTSIFLLSKIQPWRELPRLILLFAAAYCFGASVGPLINLIVIVDQSNIAKVFAGASVFVGCYSTSVLLSSKRQTIYRVSEFSAAIVIPTWMVLSPTLPELTTLNYFLGILILWVAAVLVNGLISKMFEQWFDVLIHVAWTWFLSHHLSFDLWDLLLIYLALWPFILHMTAQSQKSIYIVSRGENYYVSHTIAFFTNFPDVAAYRHLVGFLISKMWGITRFTFMNMDKVR